MLLGQTLRRHFFIENVVDTTDADRDRNVNVAGNDVVVADVENYRNASHRSKLRFHLTKRSRTLQTLLEKMFQNELI